LWLNLAMLVTGAVATASLGFFGVLPEHIPGQEFLLGSWSPLGPGEIMALVVLSVAILISSVGAAYAYQNGRPATIATFDFAYVAFAVGWGMVFFKETPSANGWVGIALIVSAGILAVRSKANAAEQGAASDASSARA
jgi:drug/metabolite transporter (DMT)-like permease